MIFWSRLGRTPEGQFLKKVYVVIYFADIFSRKMHTSIIGRRYIGYQFTFSVASETRNSGVTIIGT